ncbi:hypothetical protein OOJ91_33560 [Micromonospora lupini]|uniref:hypothetical protein n=1 Tax=Micromonospora lupini TaxID=285679 RepID=UPI0022585132|nr:hypothetical protein [Micromonospora lupini]MCX5070774.1 hypothetical protein [Micromonospora lupini]
MDSGNITSGNQDRDTAGDQAAREQLRRSAVWADIVDTSEQINEGGEPSRLTVLHEHRAAQWRRYAGLAPEAGYATAASIAAQLDDEKAAGYLAATNNQGEAAA